MATKPTMLFKRGDQVTHYLKVPIANYVVGAVLSFTAKPAVDNDLADSKAVISKSFSDGNLVPFGASNYDSKYATYQLTFLPADIIGVTYSNGSSENDYVGEFKYTTPGQAPISFPADNSYIKVKIYGDVRRLNP